jgi:hypothetical protein
VQLCQRSRTYPQRFPRSLSPIRMQSTCSPGRCLVQQGFISIDAPAHSSGFSRRSQTISVSSRSRFVSLPSGGLENRRRSSTVSRLWCGFAMPAWHGTRANPDRRHDLGCQTESRCAPRERASFPPWESIDKKDIRDQRLVPCPYSHQIRGPSHPYVYENTMRRDSHGVGAGGR